MFKFKRTQKIYEIDKIKLGGQPGENPTVLIGSIFYHGHKIVLNEKKGIFNKESAEKLIKLQEEFSDKTGNPYMLDVVGSTKKAMEKFINFISDNTEAPFLIDSPSVDVKISGVKYAMEVGLKKRIVYNSIIPESEPKELEAIKEAGVENVIVLAYKGGAITSEDRIKAITEFLPRVEEAGIVKPIIDTYVFDIPSLSLATKAIVDIKRETGFPCGCGAHNAISTWMGFRKRMGDQAIKTCAVTVNITPIILGADFILYGPIEDCKYIFPSVYAINTSYKYLYKLQEQLEI